MGKMMLTGEEVLGDKRVSVALHAPQIPNGTGSELNSDLCVERPQLVELLFPTEHINVIVINIRKLMAWN
jgi:hypothetical protein